MGWEVNDELTEALERIKELERDLMFRSDAVAMLEMKVDELEAAQQQDTHTILEDDYEINRLRARIRELEESRDEWVRLWKKASVAVLTLQAKEKEAFMAGFERGDSDDYHKFVGVTPEMAYKEWKDDTKTTD